MGAAFFFKAPGSDLLSHGLSHTTIGAGAFHCRVRDGIGWDHAAVSAKEAVLETRDARALAFGLGRNKVCTLTRAMCCRGAISRSDFELYDQATRIISIG